MTAAATEVQTKLDASGALREAVEVVREGMRGSRGIAVGVWWNVGLLVLSLAALPFDQRKILGLNPWVKPIKFDVSVIGFLLTVGVMLWALGRAGEWRRSRWCLGWGFGIAMIVEDTIIGLQSARGVRSHMNYATVHDALLFSVMGLFIALNTVLGAWLLALWFWARTTWPTVVVWGVRLGLVMLLAASAEGVRMVAHGAHTVGAADGGTGLPLVNWSTWHGDLRVAHFFALHALQIFPLVGLALAATRLRKSVQMSVLFGFAAVYGFGVWWLFAEAMRGVALVGRGFVVSGGGCGEAAAQSVLR